MRCRLLILIATVASLSLLLTGSPGLSWQPPGKGKGGPPSPTILGNSDRLFYYLSDGAESLPMANTGRLRRYLGEFARQQGITNGQLEGRFVVPLEPVAYRRHDQCRTRDPSDPSDPIVEDADPDVNHSIIDTSASGCSSIGQCPESSISR